MNTKTCTRCRATKPVSEFSKGTREADGLQDRCKMCNRETSAAYRAANREKERLRHAAYHATHKERISAKSIAWKKANPDRARESQRAFYARNRERELARRARWAENNSGWIRQYMSDWRLKNLEHCREYDRTWPRLNKGKVNEKNARRRSRLMRAIPRWADPEKIAIFYEDAAKRTKETGIEHHVDHIVPLQSKVVCGLHCEQNLQILTESENSKKNNSFPDEWEYITVREAA